MSLTAHNIGLLMVVISLACSPLAQAASIAGIDSGTGLVGPGVGIFTDGSIDPAQPDNQFGFSALWDFTLRFEHPGYIDLPIITSTTPEGVNEYDLYVSIQNFSGETWIGFQILLGHGASTSFATTPSDGLDFDTPDLDAFFVDSGTVFTIDPSTYEEDLLQWIGGTAMVAGPSTTAISSFSFPIDIPDITDFTIRFQPITASVPEPHTITLLVAATAAVFKLRRKQCQSDN